MQKDEELSYTEKAEKLVDHAGVQAARGRVIDAAAVYSRAASMYKLGKEWAQAADTYLRSAEAYFKGGDVYCCAKELVSAGQCCFRPELNKIDVGESVYKRAIPLMIDLGKLHMAALYWRELGGFEENHNLRLSIECYDNAAGLFDTDNHPEQSKDCSIKVAELLVRVHDFNSAMSAYGAIGKKMARMGGYIHSAISTDSFFNSMLCGVAVQDVLSSEVMLEQICAESAAFKETEEYKLIKALIYCVKVTSVEEMELAICSYKQRRNLSVTAITLLSDIKTQMVTPPQSMHPCGEPCKP